MPSVLAIESHAEQATLLRDLVDGQVHGPLMLVDSIEAAFAAIERGMPELILLSALMSPQDEAALIAQLRAMPRATTAEVLFTPLLERPKEPKPPQHSRWRFRSTSRRRLKGCDPSAFADQLKTYLDRIRRARERRLACRVSNIDRVRVLVNGENVGLIDLSAIGAQVVSHTIFPPGRLLEVVVESRVATIRCQAGIVWSAFEIGPMGSIGPMSPMRPISDDTRVPCYRAGLDFRSADHSVLERLCVGGLPAGRG